MSTKICCISLSKNPSLSHLYYFPHRSLPSFVFNNTYHEETLTCGHKYIRVNIESNSKTSKQWYPSRVMMAGKGCMETIIEV